MPDQVDLQLHGVVTVTGGGSGTPFAIGSTRGRTANGTPLTLRAAVSGAQSDGVGADGWCTLRITPRVSGDGSVAISGLLRTEISLRPRGALGARRIRDAGRMELRAPSGAARCFYTRALPLPGRRGLRLQLLITPTIWHEGRRSTFEDGALNTVLVAGIDNATGIGGEDLARHAVDMVADEMSFSGRFDALTTDHVSAKEAAGELGIKAPFRQSELGRLAGQLRADLVATGLVTLDGAPGLRAEGDTSVVLRLWLRERNGDDLVGSAVAIARCFLVRGEAISARAIEDAVFRAAAEAIRSISVHGSTDAVVLAVHAEPERGALVAISRGAEDGVVAGAIFHAYRGWKYIGRLKVVRTSAWSADCMAEQLSESLAPGDIARPDPTGRGSP